MSDEEQRGLRPSKKKKEKWSTDKWGNVCAGEYFFNIADLKVLHPRVENDGTYTLTMNVGTMVCGILFGKNKKDAVGAFKMLQKCRDNYQKILRDHHNKYHDNQEQLLASQKKFLNEARKHCKK